LVHCHESTVKRGRERIIVEDVFEVEDVLLVDLHGVNEDWLLEGQTVAESEHREAEILFFNGSNGCWGETWKILQKCDKHLALIFLKIHK